MKKELDTVTGKVRNFVKVQRLQSVLDMCNGVPP